VAKKEAGAGKKKEEVKENKARTPGKTLKFIVVTQPQIRNCIQMRTGTRNKDAVVPEPDRH
jgi:hypothetical protein